MKPGPAQTARRPILSGSAGFSMIEMVLALAAVAIMFGAIYAGFERLNRSYAAENVKAGTQQSARIGVEMMVQDIRLAGLNPLGTAGAGIVGDEHYAVARQVQEVLLRKAECACFLSEDCVGGYDATVEKCRTLSARWWKPDCRTMLK